LGCLENLSVNAHTETMKSVAFVLLLLPIVAVTQEMFGMGNMMSAPCMAIMRPEVKKELKLHGDQGKRVDEVMKATQKAMADAQKSMSFAEINKAIESGNAHIYEILDDAQDQRMREMVLQMRGPSGIIDEPTAKELGLTDDQLAKLKALKAKAKEDWMNVMRHMSGTHNKGDDVIDQFRKDAIAVLTPEQAEKYKAMLGKPVKNLDKGIIPF
jgi:hypothetical protein